MKGNFEGDLSQNLTLSKYSNVVQGSFEEDFSQNLPMTIEGMSKEALREISLKTKYSR